MFLVEAAEHVCLLMLLCKDVGAGSTGKHAQV
jgi:hypothetical protein